MQFLFRYANPHNFMRLSRTLLPYTAIAARNDDDFACLVRNIRSGPSWLWRK